MLLTGMVGLGLTLILINSLARASSASKILQEPLPTPVLVDVTGENPDPERMQRLAEGGVPVTPPLVPIHDSYGYTLTSGTFGEAEWFDLHATIPNSTTFSSLDGSILVNLGFPFRFYENTYTQVYLNDNGLISFGNSATYAFNDIIPVEVAPNNYIAGFWDYLDVGYTNNGGIYTSSFGNLGNRYFVAEWYNVTLSESGETNQITFEIILSEISGDITILYKDINVDGALASVGIEDSEGVDGLQYMYHAASAVTSGTKVLFERSRKADSAPHARILPAYQGKMVVGGQTLFKVQVSNNSALALDVYDISVSPAPPSDWSISLLAADGLTPLRDTNGTGIVDTGTIPSKTSKTITVVVKTSAKVTAGAYYSFIVTAKSSIVPNPTASAQFQAAVPLNLTTAFYDASENKTALLNMIWRVNVLSTPIQDPFLKGSHVAIFRKPDKGYVYAWDNRNSPEEPGYREIRFMLLGKFGNITRAMTDIDDHLSPYEFVYDGNPTLSVAPNGRIGFGWVRSDGLSGKRDIWFAVRDTDGNPVGSLVNVTSNLGIGEDNESPTLAATTNKFVLVWIHRKSSDSNGELWYSVCSQDGSSCSAPAPAAANAAVDYSDPSLAGLSGDMALLSYSRKDGSNPETINYQIFASNSMDATEYLIPGAGGWGPHALQLRDGKVLLAWSKIDLKSISYVVLADVRSPGTPNIETLTSPNNRQMGYVSLGSDEGGRGILVWVDYRYLNYLYYAAVQSDGSILTPAMSYLGEGTSSSLFPSDNGLSLAAFDGAYRVQLPFLRR